MGEGSSWHVALTFPQSLLARSALTFLISAAGGYLAYLADLPAGWLSGGLLAVAVASLAGVDTDFARPARAPAYVLLGIYAGGGVSRETLNQMQTWPVSFAILAVSVVALIGLSYWWLHGRCGWDRNAALLASLPGALSFVMAAGETLKTDMKKVAISQSLRLLLLIELIPLAALAIGHPADAPLAPALAEPALTEDYLIDLSILFGAAVALGFVLERLHLAGGWMLGGLIAGAGLRMSGLSEAHMPAPLVVLAMIALGAISGSRFRPGDFALLPSIGVPALIAFGIASVVSLISAAIVWQALGVDFIQALLAFAPGALDALTILAYQLNIDPAYVAAHHVARFLALVAAVPILARWMDRTT